ncbi:MAG TPA: 4'-phosphopantetheinyl transferase superfamily protein [Rudaea sp.]|nr:4'-phosphopantetheinyl transferase superfamily protein [Rudaea sp.]
MQFIDAADFSACRFPQTLAANTIHLWFFPHWPGASHAVAQSPLLLGLLASYAHRPVARLSIEHGAHGKPRLRDIALEFNLSHSASALLLGISQQQPLGVDIEARRRERPVLELARRWFDADEVAALESLPESLRQAAFMRLWSCKEAVLKAQGRGVGYGLNRATFDLDTSGAIASFRGVVGESTSPAWQVVGLTPAANVTGALAWCGPAHSVSAFVADTDYIRTIVADL